MSGAVQSTWMLVEDSAVAVIPVGGSDGSKTSVTLIVTSIEASIAVSARLWASLPSRTFTVRA